MSFNTEQAAGVNAEVPSETNGFVFNHTMVRVVDPEQSLAFYTKVFGMRLLASKENPKGEFTLYFLARTEGDEVPEDPDARQAYLNSRPGILELTHNWGTENDPSASYHNGNSEPQGYGHICFTVPDLQAAVAWMDANNVTFQKRPEDGRMNHIAFVLDPDGYWIELVEQK
ncbi:lactoylglutathione lyase [Salinisphaera sp. USBA-960]|uniref:lactoylglutathione lyase n=1 Tax=Salinisphaera orenii TaxID=856731 RepID=UPI000DBE57A6|nr:lactoylglutathione lyase [Salifodinibacter halophilus]NNC26122.1 lactoylglutathione lyase [Salifodinibacter halophilus]